MFFFFFQVMYIVDHDHFTHEHQEHCRDLNTVIFNEQKKLRSGKPDIVRKPRHKSPVCIVSLFAATPHKHKALDT